MPHVDNNTTRQCVSAVDRHLSRVLDADHAYSSLPSSVTKTLQILLYVFFLHLDLIINKAIYLLLGTHFQPTQGTFTHTLLSVVT